MAPEIVRHEKYSEKADVYSFAITAWQLLTRETPFAPYSSIEAAGKVAIERARPPFPVGIPKPIHDLIQTCWREDPGERMSFPEICTSLQQINLTDPKEIKWLQASMGHPVYDENEDDIVDQIVNPPGGGANHATTNLHLPSFQKPPPGRPTGRSSLRKLFSKKKLGGK